MRQEICSILEKEGRFNYKEQALIEYIFVFILYDFCSLSEIFVSDFKIPFSTFLNIRINFQEFYR